MLTEYKTLCEGGVGELTEKKSRFIATVIPIESEDEAIVELEKIKKKYWDARHNCWAYMIGTEQVLERCSDDGEPSGTAGKPILEVIRGEEVHNVLVVVTRYFGGTLLGTGGLVRAYTGAAKEGLKQSKAVTRVYGYKLRIHTDYTGLGKIQYILGKMGIPVGRSVYTDTVEIEIFAAEKKKKGLINEIAESTNGQARIENMGEMWMDK